MAKFDYDFSKPWQPDFNLGMKTKDGLPIHLEFYRNSQGDPDDKGFITHMVIARVEGLEAGYLRLAYVPREAFQARYPTIIEFMRDQEGWVGLRHKNTPRELFKGLCLYESGLICLSPGDTRQAIDEMSGKEANAALRQARGKLQKLHGHKMKWFEQHFVDNPYVDFINTHELDRSRQPNRADTLVLDQGNKTTKNWRGRGIALALYLGAGLWMQSLGMNLRASTGQSPQARRLWDQFENQGLIRTAKVKSRTHGYTMLRSLVVPENFNPNSLIVSKPSLKYVA